MVAFTFIFSSLLLASSIQASPLPGSNPKLVFPPLPGGILCKIPFIGKFLCPRPGSTIGTTVNTRIGVAQGVVDIDVAGANRFVVKYANAARWAPSTVVSAWSLPNGSTNISALPLACPQTIIDPSQYSEDCLSMVIYVPKTIAANSGVPVLMWIHGGSDVVGSATGAGLDGSNLAIATNSIVAVTQYRLGALGFMAPDGKTNLAVKDLINALTFLKTTISSFGGSTAKITLAGQSSGATLIRTLLATPSASSLFQSAILQSDPMDYGLLALSTQQALQSHFNSLISCSATDTACWNALSLDQILDAQTTLSNDAVGIDQSTGTFMPIRPVVDGTLVTSPLDSTAAFPSQSKPVLVSTVLNEAGPAIYGGFGDPVPEYLWPAYVEGTFGDPRTDTIVNSPFYPAPVTADGTEADARVQLQVLGTDSLWKCPSWTFSKSWVQHGGKAYVGLYTVGSTYPGNDAVPYCLQSGSVCHQDDIEIVFGTVPNPSTAQAALTTEMQARYKAFLTTGNPNAKGFANWTPATSSSSNAILLGGSGPAPVDACTPTFWGSAVQYDYQVYGI